VAAPGEADPLHEERRVLLVLAHGDAWEARFQVTSLAASAAAAGQRVDVALFFAALGAWVGERWDAAEPAGAVPAERLAELDLPPLTAMLAPGRADGRIRLLACSASARILGLATADVQAKVDVIAGWPTFQRLVRAAGSVVTL
jgi:predicted peroxiredoxin